MSSKDVEAIRSPVVEAGEVSVRVGIRVCLTLKFGFLFSTFGYRMIRLTTLKAVRFLALVVARYSGDMFSLLVVRFPSLPASPPPSITFCFRIRALSRTWFPGTIIHKVLSFLLFPPKPFNL